MSFDVNRHVEPLMNYVRSGPDCRDSRFAVSTIHWDKRPESHKPCQYRNTEQFFFDHDRHAAWNQRHQDWRIDIRDMIGHEDISAGGVDLVQAHGPHLNSREPNPGPCAPHG